MEAQSFARGWEQQWLFAPVAAEGSLRIGMVPDSDHYQIQYEVSDPTTDILLSMKSWPHVPGVHIRTRIMEAIVELLDLLEDKELLPTPFPDRRPES